MGKTLNAEQNGNPVIIPTLEINTMQNKDLRWERTEAFNVGIDYNLFDGVLSGSVEAYNMSTTDVLVNRELPTVTGFNRVYANFGEVKNKGFELTLNSLNMRRTNFEALVVMYSLWGMKSEYDLAKHDDNVEDRRNTWDIQVDMPGLGMGRDKDGSLC